MQPEGNIGVALIFGWAIPESGCCAANLVLMPRSRVAGTVNRLYDRTQDKEERVESLKRSRAFSFNQDSAVGSKKNGNVKSFRREIDGLVLLLRQRAVVPW
jgi:hypothetical protein